MDLQLYISRMHEKKTCLKQTGHKKLGLPLNQQTQTSIVPIASLHKHLKHYHKYFFIHIQPGTAPGKCFPPRNQTGNTAGMLKTYLDIRSTSIILHRQQKSTLEFTLVAGAIHRCLKRCREWQRSSLWKITASQGWLTCNFISLFILFYFFIEASSKTESEDKTGIAATASQLICFDSCAMTPGISRCSCKQSAYANTGANWWKGEGEGREVGRPVSWKLAGWRRVPAQLSAV